MSEVAYKSLKEILHSVADDGNELTAILELAKAGVDARVRDALAHMEKALELYEQANAEAEAARINLSKAMFEININGKFPEPHPDEMLLRVSAARAALMGVDGPGLRRRKVSEKLAGETWKTDSSLRSE